MRRRRAGPARAGLLLALASLLLGAVARAGEAPGDLRFEATPGSFLEGSIFPHWVHRLRFTCNACHPALFPMGREAKMTMDEILEGQLCGACHNGRVAFAATADNCNRCHTPTEP